MASTKKNRSLIDTASTPRPSPRPPAELVKVSHAEAARYRRLASELARIAEHRPATAEEIEAGRAAQLRRYAPTRRPPVSTLTGRPTPELPEAFYRLGPLPLDPVEGAAECRRRRGLPPRSI